jgi:hypothetical protein
MKPPVVFAMAAALLLLVGVASLSGCGGDSTTTTVAAVTTATEAQTIKTEAAATTVPRSAPDSLVGTEWKLVMVGEDLNFSTKYDIVLFAENGSLLYVYPQKLGDAHDTWKVDGNSIVISINGGYSTYIGKLSDDHTHIEGTASNKRGKQWGWTGDWTGRVD